MAVIIDFPFSYQAEVIPPRCTNSRVVGVRTTVPVRIEEMTSAEAACMLEAEVMGGFYVGTRDAVTVGDMVHGVGVQRVLSVRGKEAAVEGYLRGPAGGLMVPTTWNAGRVHQPITVDNATHFIPELAVSTSYGHSPFLERSYYGSEWIRPGQQVRAYIEDNRAATLRAVHDTARNMAFVDGELHMPSKGPGWKVNQSGAVEMASEWMPGMYRPDRLAAALAEARAECMHEAGEQEGVFLVGSCEILQPDIPLYDDVSPMLRLAMDRVVRHHAAVVGDMPRAAADAWLDLRDALQLSPRPLAVSGNAIEAAVRLHATMDPGMSMSGAVMQVARMTALYWDTAPERDGILVHEAEPQVPQMRLG
jgi:hypothetical protein